MENFSFPPPPFHYISFWGCCCCWENLTSSFARRGVGRFDFPSRIFLPPPLHSLANPIARTFPDAIGHNGRTIHAFTPIVPASFFFLVRRVGMCVCMLPSFYFTSCSLIHSPLPQLLRLSLWLYCHLPTPSPSLFLSA